ncbi:hypothetical protein [Tumebacillus sp. BK434]|uniref:hypothetical protein n=1 Tax=Tumebacillus sp. BK434 TaxID=2512169 RepID=UPI0014047BEE|nr:hypothetical protein [Tumebacillus sp. BK434]
MSEMTMWALSIHYCPYIENNAVTDATINLIKKEGTWVIANDNDAMANAVLGNVEQAFQ